MRKRPWKRAEDVEVLEGEALEKYISELGDVERGEMLPYPEYEEETVVTLVKAIRRLQGKL